MDDAPQTAAAPTYFEDVAVGARRRSRSRAVSREEIRAFGRAFDPQPFHVDDEAAERTHWGGLIASGWHTAAIAMRLLVEDLIQGAGVASLGSPGVDELRWLLPVRPGDELTVETRVLDKTPSRRRPDRGTVRLEVVVRNQRDEVVLTMISLGLVRRRPAAAAAGRQPEAAT